MYTVSDEDRVLPAAMIPHPTTATPAPVVVANESAVTVAYYAHTGTAGRNDAPWQVFTPGRERRESDESVALVYFRPVFELRTGGPNDEAIDGHPLYSRGLEPYGAYEVRPSSLVVEMERRNRVHSRHDPAMYEKHRHFAITFHDSMLECVAETVRAELHVGSISPAHMLERIGRRLQFD
ncbi:MAG: hypothetical protein AAFU73_19015 [Planctomycetota bacterium]